MAKKKAQSEKKNRKGKKEIAGKVEPAINLPVLYVPPPKSFKERYQEITSEVCKRLEEGESLIRICKSDHLPSKSTIMDWLDRDKLFADQYARAREIGIELMADEITNISDSVMPMTDHVAKARLMIDSRKWLLSKMLPKKYGDRVEHEHKGEIKHKHQAEAITYQNEEEAERAHRELLK